MKRRGTTTRTPPADIIVERVLELDGAERSVRVRMSTAFPSSGWAPAISVFHGRGRGSPPCPNGAESAERVRRRGLEDA